MDGTAKEGSGSPRGVLRASQAGERKEHMFQQTCLDLCAFNLKYGQFRHLGSSGL